MNAISVERELAVGSIVRAFAVERGFVIEPLDDGRFTVFVPSVPTPLAGAVYILTPETRPSPTRAWPVGATRSCAAFRPADFVEDDSPLVQHEWWNPFGGGSETIHSRRAHAQVAPHGRHIFSRQDVGAYQVELAPNLPRQIGQVDAHLLGKAERQVLHGADRLQRVSSCPGLVRKACNRRFADKRDVTEWMFGEPWIDHSVLEPGACLRRHGDRTADLPHLVEESARDLDGLSLEWAEGAGPVAVAEELMHLACKDPRVDEGSGWLQPKARLTHLRYCADSPEQGVAPDVRIGSPPFDRGRSEVDFRGERDRVFVHACPQRFHADVGADFWPGPHIGLRRLLPEAGACHQGGQCEARARAHPAAAPSRRTSRAATGCTPCHRFRHCSVHTGTAPVVIDIRHLRLTSTRSSTSEV
jgi:hypothetical protein